MINQASSLLIRAAKSCTPTLGKTLRVAKPNVEKSVMEIAKIAQGAKGSQTGKFLASLADAGDSLVGLDGIVSFSFKQSAKHSDTTVLTAIFKKGNNVVAKMASTISPNGSKIGGSVNQTVDGIIVPHNFHLSEITTNAAEKFKMLAKKLGIDLRTAQERLTTAKLSGKNISDEKVLEEVLLGKFAHTPGKSTPNTLISDTNIHFLDQIPADNYFGLGYRRLFESEDSLLASINGNNKLRQAMGYGPKPNTIYHHQPPNSLSSLLQHFWQA